ncbi:DUF490 domain-containing protein [Pseudoalteromonas sp. CO342X]|uniref:autotransporter assembly complex protein TamB n=1 Tax=Pseudoalteromonas sp. CO342X TaxID=1777270 RepID=UPI001022AED0|nr:translocation/assembly module TamB domain-containing protein [Pseudoalteromonas sp. CO342X]RZG17077.1 DUF490 domain-containing protein [Pseudoalteromonas sp. CO342X]
MQFRSLRIKIITAIISLFLLLVCLCFTLPGQQLLVWVANKTVSGLEIDGLDKRLLSGAKLTLRYHNDDIDIRLRDTKVTVEWLTCASVCIALDAKAIAIVQKQKSVSEAETTESGQVELPLPIAIKRAQVQQFSLETPDITVQLQGLDTQLSGSGSHFNVPFLLLDSVKLTTKATDQPVSAKSPAPLNALAPLQLPKIDLPLTAELGELKINNLAIDEQTLENIKLSHAVVAENVDVEQVQLNYQEFFISAAAEVLLNDWAIDLRSTLSAPQGLASLTLAGRPHDLTLTLNSEGMAFAKLQAHADLTATNWPFELQGQIDKLVIPSEPTTLKGATLGLSGDVSKYHLSGSVAVNTVQFGDVTATLEGQGGLQAFTLAKAKLQLEKAQAQIAGQVNWSQGVKGKVDGDFSQLPVDRLLGLVQYDAGLTENDMLAGQFALDFVSKGEQWQVNVEHFKLDGKVAGAPLNADVKVVVDESLLGEFSHARLNYGKNSLTVSGELGQQLDLDIDFQFEQAANTLIPADLKGSGEIFIQGDHLKPSIQTDIKFDSVRYQNIALHGLTTKGTVDIANEVTGQIKLALDRLIVDSEMVEDIRLAVKGNQQQHNATLDIRDKRVVASFEVNGKMQQSTWQGELSSGEVTSQGQTIALQSPAAIVISDVSQRIAKQCWQMGDTDLCFAAEQQGTQGQADVKLEKLALAKLQTWLPAELKITGETQAVAKLAWQNGQVTRADGELNIVDAGVTTHGQTFSISEFKALLKTNNKQIHADWRMTSDTLGKFSGDTRVPLDKQSPQLAGNVKIESIELAKLSALLNRVTEQSFDLQGEVLGDINISGSLAAPEVNGKLTAQRLFMSSDSLPVEIDKGHINLDFNTTSAQLEAELTAAKGGKVALTGEAYWSPELSAEVKIKGENIYVQPDSQIELTASPDLTLAYKDKIARVLGEIVVPFGRVNIESLPEGVTSPSDDEVIVDAKVQKQMSVPIQHEIDLKLTVKDNFRVKALGLDSFVTGAIEIDKQVESPMLATGELQLREGKYRAFGQDLLIRTGQIGFNGALDKPYLNIRAIRNPATTANDVIAGVELTGNIAKPRLTVFSEPAMDQAKALSYLLNGQPLGESETSNNALLTQFLLSQGIDRSEGFFSKAGESLGLSDVNLSAKGSGDDTQVEVSGYITPNVQVSYRVGVFESINEIALRYRVFSKFYVEATSGLYNSIDFLYKFDWDDK